MCLAAVRASIGDRIVADTCRHGNMPCSVQIADLNVSIFAHFSDRQSEGIIFCPRFSDRRSERITVQLSLQYRERGCSPGRGQCPLPGWNYCVFL